MRHKRWSIITSLFVVASVLLVACGGTKAGAEKQGGTVVMGFYQEPELLNAFIRTQTVAGIAGNFLERGLTEVLPSGERVPDLVTEVPSVQNGGVSEDGLTITYQLKEKIVWSDGDAFDCQDVVFTWEAIMHPESGAVSTSGYEDMESVTCQDEHTVVVQYAEFYAPYLTRFGVMLPSHIGLDPAKMQEWEYNRKAEPVLGPFMIEEWVSGDHMTIVRNEKYELWKTEGKPYLDSIVLRWIESREVGKQLIQTGEIDFLWDLIEADIPEAQTWDGVVLSSPPDTGTERLLLNLADPELDAPCNEYLRANPSPHWALGDPKVREAIELGIDKHRIVDKLLYGLATVGTTELNLGWAKSDIPESEYDPEKAKTLLEEAGWKDEDGDGIRECRGCAHAEDGKALKLKLQTTSGNALREAAEQVIIEMMAEIGIEMYIENVPSSELFASYSSGAFRKHGQFDILMYTTSYGIDPQSHVDGYFASYQIPCDDNSGRGYNYARWVDDEFDKWVNIAGTSPDIAVRADAYQKAAERIAEGRPHIYLYDRMEINVHVEELKGWENNNCGGSKSNSLSWLIYVACGRLPAARQCHRVGVSYDPLPDSPGFAGHPGAVFHQPGRLCPDRDQPGGSAVYL
jgi:peptide/nickel transport system substrate-binding protein